MAPDELDLRLRDLEKSMAVFHVRWEGHREASEKMWADIDKGNSRIDSNIKKIFDWLEGLPCKERAENTRSVWRNINHLWKVIGATAAALLAVILKTLFPN
jgi:hypothetical protein